jgi:uncharacterized membrane protein (UPF0127 family)
MRSLNQRNNKLLASDVVVADTVFRRMKGLLGRDNLLPGEAMWLRPCKWLHTVGMKFHVDILFLDEDNTVIDAEEDIPPNRFSAFILKSGSAVELPAGTIALTETQVGDRIEFQAQPTRP